MSVDLERDERRLRRLMAAVAAILLLSLGAAGYLDLWPEWRHVQAGFSDRAPSGSTAVSGIQELSACNGEVDRCTTCHLAALRQNLGESTDPEPYRSHAISLAAHPPHRFGCTSCHGGVGRALSAAAAHALPGNTTRDPLLKAPFLEASCARCHLPGEVRGTERLVRGTSLFFALGCGMCHSLALGGRGAWDDGPELRTLGRRSIDELKTSLFDPKADFAESTMPSYETSFRGHPEELVDLEIFVQSLTLPRLGACASRGASDTRLWTASCTTCHVGDKAVGRLQHRCVYLKERGPELACGNCHHGSGLETATGDCPVVREHRGACVACHWESGN